MGLKFAEVDLSTYGLVVTGVRRDILADVISSDQKVIGKKGVYSFDPEVGSRDISLDCQVIGSSHADMLSKLDSVLAVLNPLNGLGKLVLETQLDRYYLAKLRSKPSADIMAVVANMSLDFSCPDAYAYATNETEEEIADISSFNFVAGGNAEPEPVYELTAANSATAGTVKLKNVTLNKELTWIGTWAAGKVLRVDTVDWTVSYDGIISMLGVSGEFPKLSPGVSNVFTVTGMTGTGVCIYRARYL